MINTLIILFIIYLLAFGGKNGIYNKRRMNGYGRNNRNLSQGRYSEYGGYGNMDSTQFNQYDKYQDQYGRSNNPYGGNNFGNNDFGNFGNNDFGNFDNNNFGQSNQNNDNFFDKF